MPSVEPAIPASSVFLCGVSSLQSAYDLEEQVAFHYWITFGSAQR